MRGLADHKTGEFLVYASALITTAAICISLLYFFIEKLYFFTWLISLEQFQENKEGKTKVHLTRKRRFFFQPTSNQERVLLNKDILIFLREPAQWTQLLLIVALLAIYFFNLRFIPADIELEQWRTILFIMNFGFCGFVLATLAIRFVFPSISLEGDTFWVIGSSPVSIKTLFREKFISAFITFFIVAEAIGLVSTSLLKLEGLYRILTFSGIFLMSVSLSCLSIGLGATYPDFSERNPSKIVSSPGGILTIILSLVYLGVMIAMVTIPVYKYTKYLVAGEPFPLKELLLSCIVIGIINILTIVLPLRSGAHSFVVREF
jgi:ABC-2 type transport system permease protein